MLNEQNKHSWCINPYIHLAVVPRGEVIPCCQRDENYVTDSGNTTVYQESVNNFWNSKSRHQLINQLEEGKRPKGCNHCWSEEDAGKRSKRIRDNERWSHVDVSKVQTPLYIYLAMGNLCNLKCRICAADRSSLFAKEEASISWIKNLKMKVFNESEASKNSFGPDNKNFWDDILPLMATVEQLDFSGGEPLYVKNHWKIIDYVVEHGYSKNQSLHYSTNGTVFPEKYISQLNTFKVVDMCISIDGIGKKFEYIRHPGNFKEVDANIDKFVVTRDTSPTLWSLQSALSVSIFNIWDVAETYEYCRDKTLNMYLNMVHDHRSIKFIPRKLKDKIIERLLQHNSKYDDWVQNRDIIISYLNNSNYNAIQWRLFWRDVRRRDEYRKENFADVFPDYYEEIKKHL